MIRKIIEIDEVACTGCGLCVTACHEGAIDLVEGKARLLRDDYCDCLGDCLPACPAGAISFVEREAAAYDEAAVLAAKQAGVTAVAGASAAMGASAAAGATAHANAGVSVNDGCAATPSAIASWPIELKLVPVRAPYFDGANLLVAADCTAFAYADFHRDFMRGCVTLIGCPKLDGVNYADKLADIFASNNIASVTVARMEVPCCGGLDHAVRSALAASGKDIPVHTSIISTRGELL